MTACRDGFFSTAYRIQFVNCGLSAAWILPEGYEHNNIGLDGTKKTHSDFEDNPKVIYHRARLIADRLYSRGYAIGEWVITSVSLMSGVLQKTWDTMGGLLPGGVRELI